LPSVLARAVLASRVHSAAAPQLSPPDCLCQAVASGPCVAARGGATGDPPSVRPHDQPGPMILGARGAGCQPGPRSNPSSRRPLSRWCVSPCA
jgi:hypothetical protein